MEAAKRQRANIMDDAQSIATLQKPYSRKKASTPLSECPGCGSKPHLRDRTQCPAYGQTCHNCHKIGHYARVCRAKPVRHDDSLSPPSVNTIRIKQPTLFNIHHIATTVPALLITIHISSLNGSSDIEVLPDSGADISAAGKEALSYLNEHIHNLLPSRVTPSTVSGAKMHPLGKLPVKLRLGDKEYTDNFYIYPNIRGALLSWKTCKKLGILPECYPQPISHALNETNSTTISSYSTHVTDTPVQTPPLSPEYVKINYSTVFDGHIRSMKGEEFHISLTNDAKPFCVKTPCLIPFAY